MTVLKVNDMLANYNADNDVQATNAVNDCLSKTVGRKRK